ncbi:MAG TPA: glycosyltransferase [Candidatus Lambdaproteobacteria bacterium]|nr:glycosyltransferase [Candidatus Lambdaproteobacteria bacterium]HIB92687.1 glycosyltransferase [Candidatus Lambdaproteobacteria bacterium]HIN46779.1 glycosyltransferase [Deltaproteobacteria bacterium]HIO11071.1 glycosyltransferase [Deltaproteobacteria bacterium]HIO82942.1 glycosyltransferase [Deltaproteobacteria bacterium]
MKILIGSNVHWWNAEAAYAATIAQLLKEAGHTVFVLTRPDSLNAQHLKERGLRLLTHIDLNSNNPILLFSAYRKLKKFLLDERIDLINPHRSEGFPLFVFTARAVRSVCPEKTLPVIRTRGTTRQLLQHWLNRKMHTDWTEFYITTGEIVSKRLLNSADIFEEKLKTIYYPVVCPELPLQPRKDFRNEFKIPEKAKVLAVVGRIRPVKGQRILLQSLSQLLPEFPDLVLLIPYRDTAVNEPEMQALRSDIRSLNLEANIRLIPERDDIRKLMEFADAGVVSSVDSEVICRVAVEFFSVATPVVAFPTGCLPEIIRDGENGLLVKNQTPEALTKELRKILANPELRERLGKGARSDAEIRFNPQKMLTETLEVFEHFLN